MRVSVLVAVLVSGCVASDPQWATCDDHGSDCGGGAVCITTYGVGFCSRRCEPEDREACADLANDRGNMGRCVPYGDTVGGPSACIVTTCEGSIGCPDDLRCLPIADSATATYCAP
jgi:hypothetical protein